MKHEQSAPTDRHWHEQVKQGRWERQTLDTHSTVIWNRWKQLGQEVKLPETREESY